MFISTHRFNPFEEYHRSFDSFWNDNDLFNPFVVLTNQKRSRPSKEDKLKTQLNRLQNEENDLNHYIKQYEQQLQQLKKSKENIETQRTEITNKITKIVEEKKKKIESNKSTEDSKPECYIFKKSHYKTDGMEIEEQYDSSNPKNCYKVIRKQGEAPQIIQGEDLKKTIENPKEKQQDEKQQEKKQEEEKQHEEKTEVEEEEFEVLDEKYQQLTKLVGNDSTELQNLYQENKDLTIGQLFDKASELKLF